MQTSTILPLFYLPPIGFFSTAKGINFDFQFEKHEHFPKQTFRNRASIASPDGVLDLIVPVIKGAKVHTAYQDVKISYDMKWQRLHWLSLQTCYRSSAYFEFYEDGIAPFYEQKFDFLFDYNLALFEWITKQLKLTIELKTTSTYEKEISKEQDFRNKFNKKEVYATQMKPYFQVFIDRNSFIPNLSILDLLFTQGPQAKSFF
jgi:hypothetical protein